MNYFLKNIKKDFKHSFLNKYLYKSTKQLPAIEKIILSFKYKNNDLKKIVKSMLLLKIIVNQKSCFKTAKKLNIKLSIKKGQPVGSFVTLRNKNLYLFLDNLLNTMLTDIKKFKTEQVSNNILKIRIHEFTNLKIIEKQYYIFSNLPNLDISFVFSNTENGIKFKSILKSLKIYLKNSEYNLIGRV